MINIKKSMLPLTQYRKDKKISLCNELFKNEINYLPKKKFCSKNISKIKITHLNNEEEKKKNSAKIITSYFNSRLPSPKNYKGNILIKKHFNILNKSKNKTLIKAYKTLNNSKYFSKRNSHVIFIKNKK